MKKSVSIVLAVLMLLSVLSLPVFAEKAPLWSDYFSSVEILDLDQVEVKGHTEKNGDFICDEWNVPQQFRFTKKDGGKIDVTADTSGMQDASDDVVFTVEVESGVVLTFVEYMTVLQKNNCILLGISQKFGDGDDAEYVEVTSVDVNYDLSSGANNDKSSLSIWDRIVLFFKDLIQKIEVFFLRFSSN